jgi:hypothetical protein
LVIKEIARPKDVSNTVVQCFSKSKLYFFY